MKSRFVLYEDDGTTLRHADGDFAEVAIDLTSTMRTVTVSARVSGRHALPYERMRVVLPKTETRAVVLRGEGVNLAR